MKSKHIIISLLLALLLLAACGRVSDSIDTPTWREQYDLGMRYLSQGNYEEAVIAFQAAIDIDPRSADAHVGLGQAYVGLGEHQSAAGAFQTAIGIDSGLVEAYLGLAEAYIGLGDMEAALDALREGYDITDDERLLRRLEELEAAENLPAGDAGEPWDGLWRWPDGTVMPQELTVLVRQEVERYYEPDVQMFPPGIGYSVSYEYDRHGFLTRAVRTWTGYIDENGNMEHQRFSADGRIGSEVTVDTWEYDDETGRRTGSRDGDPDHPQVMELERPGVAFAGSTTLNICSSPFAEDYNLLTTLRSGEPLPGGRPQRIDNSGEWYHEADWDYAFFEYDEFNNTVKIDSYRHGEGLYGTAWLEWAVLVLGPDGTYSMG